jgi:protein-S-isoprenylcysteine O-methyltransferase Ste14
MSPVRRIAKFFFGMAIFVGLPLIGWGMEDFGVFFAHPARFGYVLMVVFLQLFVVLRFPEAGGEKRGTVTACDRLELLPFQILPLIIVLVASYADRRSIAVFGNSGGTRYLGLVLFSLGFVFMIWAEASLGRNFNLYLKVQNGHKLVTDGPYRYVRHPRYLGIIVFFVGISLVYRSWLALIFVTLLVVAILWRIRKEEQLLHRVFGIEWESYVRKSWRLLPFVY